MQTGLWLFMLSAAFATVLSVAITGAGLRMYSYYADQLTDIGSLTEWEEEFQSVRIYDRTGEHLLLISLDPRPFSGDRTYVALEDMSPWIWKSAIAMEDRTYWTNPGISLRGITRAFLSNLTGGEVQGGSSITQQLIKNVAIPVEQRAQRSYARKIKELILAMELTRRHSKEQILEWYLNFNFYGNLAYGIEAASHVYFDKSSADLSLAEASMLALIPQYQALNPYFSPERAKERQGITLNGMVDAGYITQEEADAAFAARVPSLVVWGGLDADGKPFLEPAFLTDAMPTLPPEGRDFTLRATTEGGSEAFALRFDMPSTQDADDGQRAFVFSVPVTWTGALESIALFGSNGSAVLDRDTDRPFRILKDRATGQVRAFLRGRQAAAVVAADATGAAGYETLFSAGIPDSN